MEAPRISPAELKQRLDAGDEIFLIDARNADAWRKATRQIPGATRIAADELDAHLSEIPEDRTVVAYCT
jgi:rhodanese-related sulfurtransferase